MIVFIRILMITKEEKVMYAKIINNENKIYYSPVLLLKYSGLSSWAVIFDESFSKLIKISYWNNKKLWKFLNPNILLINYDSKDYPIFNEKLKAIWNKKRDLFRCKLGKFSEEQIEYAKQFIKKEEINQYINISSICDLKALQDAAGGFHDGYLLEINKSEEYEEFLFDTTWGNYISIRTSGKLDNHMFLYETISDSKVKIVDDNKKIEFINMFNFENEEKDMYLSAEKMSFEPFFERKTEIKDLKKFEFIESKLLVNGKIEIPLANERIIFSDDEDYIQLFFKAKDTIYKLVIVDRTNVIDELISAFKQKGFEVSEIDIYVASKEEYISNN